MKDIVEELKAKAWQSTRHGKGQRAEDHVCFRAALEIARLRSIEHASDAEKGWRTFWQAIVQHLHLDTKQRSYRWHEIQDGCARGMDAVKRSCEKSQAA